MQTYRALVICTLYPNQAEAMTYVGANSAAQAKAKLEGEGFAVRKLWVLELA